MPKILVIEDEPDIREIFREEFECEGFEVFEASGPIAGFQIFIEQKPEVIISDICMSEGNGLEILQKIKDVNLPLPLCLFITGYSDMNESEIIERGATAVFQKPFKLAEIVAFIKGRIKQ